MRVMVKSFLVILILDGVISLAINSVKDQITLSKSISTNVLNVTEVKRDNSSLINRKGFYQLKDLNYSGKKDTIDNQKVQQVSDAVKLFIAETIYDVSNIADKVSVGIYRTASAFASDTLQLIILARDNLTDIIKVIAIKILEIDDKLVKEFFENIKDLLEKIQKLFVHLLKQAEGEFDNILNHVNNTIMSISEDMDEWSNDIKRKLKSVKNNEIYKTGCDYVDNFVHSSVEEAYECCNIAIKPMRSICKNAKDIIGDTLNIVVNILEKVEMCILEKKARIHIMIACLDDAYDEVSLLMKHASDLKDSLFKTLPSKIMLSNFCFSMAAISVEVRKIDISNEIDKKYLN